MTERILIGHFLLRHDAARRGGISGEELVQRPDLLRIGGRWLQEVYFEFQFDEFGIRRELGSLVQTLRRDFDDLVVADWLVRPNEALSGATPLVAIAKGVRGDQLSKAVANAGPIADPESPSPPSRHLTS
jgi:hypothetical protein